MSLSKRQKFCLSDSEKRQSFSERICDDLSEVILQYLSLEDKLRLECVSKQFQRNIFQRHNELRIGDIVSHLGKSYSEALESVLKKCAKINSIVFDIRLSIVSSKPAFDLIDKYSHNLVEMSGYLPLNDQISQNIVKRLNTKSFSLNIMSSADSLFGYLSHIHELHIKYSDRKDMHSFYKTIYLYLSQITSLSNLRSVPIRVNGRKDLQLLQTFVTNNKRLEKLDIKLYDEIFNANPVDPNLVFNSITKLTHLVELRLWTDDKTSDKLFCDGLRRIAVNCPKMKSFSFKINIYWDMNEMLSHLKAFKQLKRLHLFVVFEYAFSNGNNKLFDGFDGFQDLTHLTLTYERNQRIISEEFLTNIDINLPKLTYLDINKRFLATDWTIDILSRLSRLETIKLNLRNNSRDFHNRFTAELIQKCKYIRNIELI